jgi:putative FmdB family regulatory protein
MPIWEYECQKCHSIIEKLVTWDEARQGLVLAPLCVAEGCNAEFTKRIMSKTSFVLNGTGWARDGYSGAGK